MKIIFFGTPELVVPVLAAIHKEFDRGIEKNLVAVVTQPPKLVGRKQFLSYSPVDNWAHKYRIQIIRDLSNDELPEADLGILAAYGKIIPEKIINHFKYGILNIHPSLLPKFRGASPIQGAIAAGLKETGVSVIKMDKEIDHGPIVSQFKEEIREDDTTETLTKRLFERSADFIVALIPNYISGKIRLKEQDHAHATYTKILKKEDGFIKPEVLQASLINLSKKNPEEARNFIRAMYPWPGVWTTLNTGKRLKLLKAHLEDGKLVLDQVQLEGKNPVSWKEFKQGYPDVELGQIG